jgi:hypothetical protein
MPRRLAPRSMRYGTSGSMRIMGGFFCSGHVFHWTAATRRK